MEEFAKKLEFLGEIYEYSHAKKNVLTYISQPIVHYSDWEENGGILIVQYRPEKKGKDKYYVLHQIVVTTYGKIIHNDISAVQNRIATIVRENN